MQIHILYFNCINRIRRRKGRLAPAPSGVLDFLFGVLGVLIGVLGVLVGILGVLVGVPSAFSV